MPGRESVADALLLSSQERTKRGESWAPRWFQQTPPERIQHFDWECSMEQIAHWEAKPGLFSQAEKGSRYLCSSSSSAAARAPSIALHDRAWFGMPWHDVLREHGTRPSLMQLVFAIKRIWCWNACRSYYRCLIGPQAGRQAGMLCMFLFVRGSH